MGKASIRSVAIRLKKQITGLSNDPSSALNLPVNIQDQAELKYSVEDDSLEASMNEESRYGDCEDEFEENQVVRKAHIGKYDATQAYFAVINAFFSLNKVFLPKGFKTGGYLFSVLFLLLIAVLTFIASLKLI